MAIRLDDSLTWLMKNFLECYSSTWPMFTSIKNDLTTLWVNPPLVPGVNN